MTKKHVLTPEEGVAGKFIHSYVDEYGALKEIEFVNDDDFNFAYDVVDVLAEKCPDKTAMVHISKHGRERKFTFRDMLSALPRSKKGRQSPSHSEEALPVLVHDTCTS